jgi:hypothetical protein
LHAHVKDPGVFVQVAFAWQLSVLAVHSFTSVQVTPLPVKPVLQAQVKLPRVFRQVAFALQLSVLVVHSSTSLQVNPSPV